MGRFFIRKVLSTALCLDKVYGKQVRWKRTIVKYGETDEKNGIDCPVPFWT